MAKRRAVTLGGNKYCPAGPHARLPVAAWLACLIVFSRLGLDYADARTVPVEKESSSQEDARVEPGTSGEPSAPDPSQTTSESAASAAIEAANPVLGTDHGSVVPSTSGADAASSAASAASTSTHTVCAPTDTGARCSANKCVLPYVATESAPPSGSPQAPATGLAQSKAESPDGNGGTNSQFACICVCRVCWNVC